MRFSLTSLTVTALLAGAGMASAEDWSVLSIGNPSRNAPSAFADAFHAAEALGPLGHVNLQREIGADDVAAALDNLIGQPKVMIYFVGAIGVQSSGPMLMGQGGGDTRAAIGPLLERLATGGTTEVALLIEDCAGGNTMAGRLAAPEVPEGLSLYLAASAGPDGDCAAVDTRLTDRLMNNTGDSLQDALAGLWVGADMLDPIPLETAAAPSPVLDIPETGAGDIVIATVTTDPGPGDGGISIVNEDVVLLTPTVEPVSATEVVGAVRPSVEDVASVEDTTVIFVAPPASQLAALPLQAGLPEPSIIVGLIEQEEEASFGVVEDEDDANVDSNEITFDNLEARRALREDNPDLFLALVEGGAFDPPDVELARALQTELARMGCYRSGIDGIWGNGSRSSVDRYFAEAGGTPVNREPTTELFRQIIVKDDVDCPAPAPAPVAASRPSGGGSTPRPATQTARPAPQPARPAPAPAPAPAPSGGGLGNANLGGVFR